MELTRDRVDGLGSSRAFAAEDAVAEHTVRVIYLAGLVEYAIEVATLDGSATASTTFVTDQPPRQVDSQFTFSGEATSRMLGSESGIGGADTFSGQHDFKQLPDGRYMVLDSGHGRGLVFTFDEETLTATMEASYRTADGSCGAQGTATMTADGNPIVSCMTRNVREYDHVTAEPIWDGTVVCRDGGGGFAPAPVRWYSLDTW